MNKKTLHFTIFDAAKKRSIKSSLMYNLREIIRYRYALCNLIKTNLRTRYRRSIIGFLWSLLNPLLTMTILTVVFSTVFKSSVSNFSIYIFSGLLPWTLISNSMVSGSLSIISGEGYLKKIYVPKLIFPLTTVGVEVVNFLLSLLSLSLLAIFLGAKINWGLLTIPLALLLTATFLLGLVLIISIATVYFRDLSHIIQIAIIGLFYLTPILYPIELLSSNLLAVIRLNPFFYFVELFRVIIYRAEIPNISLWLTCLSLATISLILGFIVFDLKEKDVIYRL